MQMHANYKVLLLIWNDGLRFDAGYQLLEVFSGEGRVSQKWYHGEHPPAHTSVQQTIYYSLILMGTRMVSSLDGLGTSLGTKWHPWIMTTRRNI